MHSFRPPRGGSSPAALPALLRASHLFGLALGSALGKLRESGATAARLFERAEESALLLRMMREAAEILGARWDKVPERQRPHYAPEQRFRILRIRSFLCLSQRETAEMFRVSTETIARWEIEATGADREVARPLVATDPPVRRFADVVRAVVKTMELAGFGGNDLIARTLARAGWKLSARTVGRIRQERWPMPRVPEAASTIPRAVRARHPNHVWMVELTDVKGLFGIVTFKVGVVFDAFSRMPLSARVFSKEASAIEIARLVSRTAQRHGRPAHFVSDQARCFKGQIFRRKLRRLGVKQRFGAVGKKGSIALIERLWRTLKDTLGLRLLRPLAAENLVEKIEMGLVHYAHFRPHQALAGATPAEIYLGRTPSHLSAIPPPRGKPGEGPMDLPFRVEYFDAERLLPVLVRKAARKGRHEDQRRALERANVRASAETESPRKALVSARQRASQFPLRPYMNHHFGANEDAYFQIVDSLPDAKLISLLNIAQAEGVPILVTLKNRKTYVGYVDQFSLNHDCHHFQIFPTDSGYRSEHELDVCLRNEYTRILEIFKAIKERAATQEDLEVLRRLKIILRTDDVVSASLWDWDIWDQHRRAREAPPASGLCRALTE